MKCLLEILCSNFSGVQSGDLDDKRAVGHQIVAPFDDQVVRALLAHHIRHGVLEAGRSSHSDLLIHELRPEQSDGQRVGACSKLNHLNTFLCDHS